MQCQGAVLGHGRSPIGPPRRGRGPGRVNSFGDSHKSNRSSKEAEGWLVEAAKKVQGKKAGVSSSVVASLRIQDVKEPSALQYAPGSFVEFGEDDRAANAVNSRQPVSATISAQLNSGTKDRTKVTLSPVPAPSDLGARAPGIE
jgi:hypothetical protein